MSTMVIARILIISLLIITIQALDIRIGGRTARFERFDGMCIGNPDALIRFNYSEFRTEGNKLIMNSTITVKENIVTPPSLTMRVLRCDSKEDRKSCKEHYSFNTKQYCKLIVSKSDLWTPFFGTIQPKWRCPIKKGFYKSINSSFDVTAFLLFPSKEGFFWRVTGDMYDGDTAKRIFCLVLEAYITSSKT